MEYKIYTNTILTGIIGLYLRPSVKNLRGMTGIRSNNRVKVGWVFTARSTYASAVLGIVILFVRPSVCPSVCHTHACDEKIEHTADILIPHKSVITLGFLIPTEVGG